MTVLDQRKIGFETSNSAATAFVTAKVIVDVVEAIYVAGTGQTAYALDREGWRLELRALPQLQVVVHIGEPKLIDAVRGVLRLHGFVVKTMRVPDGSNGERADYLAVII